MLNLIVCIKQVPIVSELPWDSKTGTLRRELAEGMVNPSCKHALEAAIRLSDQHNGKITVFSMGPPMAEEALYEAVAMGANRGVLLTDKRMAGADTHITSLILARAIKKKCPDFDLVLCGDQTSDSETAQVGPQLAEELGIPGVANVEKLDLSTHTLCLERQTDDFLEILEMDLPGLVTISPHYYVPRHVSLGGVQQAFDYPNVDILRADDLELDPGLVSLKHSPTKIIRVYSPATEKENIVLKGAVKRIVNELFDRFGDRIGGAIGKDLKTHDHP
jgi:electron transfer flavoprotein beta subunit